MFHSQITRWHFNSLPVSLCFHSEEQWHLRTCKERKKNHGIFDFLLWRTEWFTKIQICFFFSHENTKLVKWKIILNIVLNHSSWHDFQSFVSKSFAFIKKIQKAPLKNHNTSIQLVSLNAEINSVQDLANSIFKEISLFELSLDHSKCTGLMHMEKKGYAPPHLKLYNM